MWSWHCSLVSRRLRGATVPQFAGPNAGDHPAPNRHQRLQSTLSSVLPAEQTARDEQPGAPRPVLGSDAAPEVVCREEEK